MRESFALFLRYAGLSVRSQLQYRASFVMLAVGHFLITCIDFAALWALFDRFGTMSGWTLPEVGLFYGMVHVAFALSEGLARGFDIFYLRVQDGGFDRLLLRPRSTAFQVAALEVQLFRIGRLTQGMIVLLWSASKLGIAWSPAKALLCALSILGGGCLFSGMFVLQATLSFWTISSLELLNTITYGGVETASYPLEIYRPWFRRFFTFVVPLACVNYLPAHALLDRPGTPLQTALSWASPLLGVAFLATMLAFWQVGVRHYRSTGS